MKEANATIKRTLAVLLTLLTLMSTVSLGMMKVSAAYESKESSYCYPIRQTATTGRGFTSGHSGVDLSVAKGTAIYSAKAGTVVKVYSGCKNYSGAGNGTDCKAKGCSSGSFTYMNGSGYKAGYYCNGGFGNGVVVQNDDGKFCYYAHMNSISVKLNDKITTKTKLGEVGSSGCSTGAHLHFSVSNKASGGTNYDPFNYIFPGFSIKLTNNGSGSVNPQVRVNFAWQDFEAQQCTISFGTSASSLSKTSTDSNFTAAYCFYNLGTKFGNLTAGKTYYFKISIKKNGTTYNSNVYSFVAGGGNKTLLDYAAVDSTNVTVTFNGNGGTPSKTSETFSIGKEYGDAFPSATGKEGYSFDGWYTAASGGTRYSRDSLATAGVKTLYAHWAKNSENVLEVNHIYKIYNEKSNLPWQVNGSSSGNYVCQAEEGGSVNSQLWRVTYVDDNGYYKFESLCGLNALDMNANNKFGYRNHLQIYTPHGNDSQTFALVYRSELADGTRLYTIHSKNSGRVVNVNGASLNAGAELNQWDYHGYGQRFYFVEQTERRVLFFDNLNNNYLASPKEVYDQIGSTTPTNHYSSRDTSYATVSINPAEDSLIIKQVKAGSTAAGAIAGDLKWIATLNGSYGYDVCELDDSTMTLRFRAKSSVAGTKMHFRWGYTSDWYSVTLSTAWADYSIDLPRDQASGNNLHPVIDKACTVEIKDILMVEKGTTDDYIGDTDTFSAVRVNGDVNNAASCYTPLPTKTKEGYTFEGWYTKRVGGTKVAEGNDYYDVTSLSGHTNLYAHWTKDETCAHDYKMIVKEYSCTEGGFTTYICTKCGDSFSDDYILPSGHDYQTTVKQPACTETGCTIHTCSRCGDRYTDNEVEALGHDYLVDYQQETCITEGHATIKCSRCTYSHTETIAANHRNHVNTTDVTETASTCIIHGYSAGVYCNDCKQFVIGHQELPLADHTLTTINQKAAGCLNEGYTGDQYCTVCKQTIALGTATDALGHSTADGNGNCMLCGMYIGKPVEPTEPTQPTQPTEPTQPTVPSPLPHNVCKWCGGQHSGGFLQQFIGAFHSLFAAIFGAKY